MNLWSVDEGNILMEGIANKKRQIFAHVVKSCALNNVVDIIKQREKEETSIDHQIHIQLTLKFLFIPYPFKIVTQVEKIREVYFQTHTFLFMLT